jgi:ABC-type sugar transport system substrate-binding protein
MKRFIAIALALLMLLSLASLAACGEKAETEKEETEQTETADTENTEDTDTEVTEEMLKNSKNNEYVKEKLAAGWDMKIACSAQNDVYFVSTQLMGTAMEAFEKEGFSCTYYVGADQNVADQINSLETLVMENAVCGICIQTGDPAALQDSVEAAQDAGISVVVYGIEVEYPTIVAMTDTYNTGYGAGVMASAWIDARYPDAGEGDVHVAILGAMNMPPVIALFQGLKDGAAADSRMTVSYVGDNDGDKLENGYTGAENAMMLDPETRVFLVYQMSAGLGVNNYLEAQGYDLGEFGIFGTSEDDTTQEMLEKAGNNESAFRGTIVAGSGVSDTMVEAMLGALYGEIEIGTTLIDPMKAWTSSDYTCDWTIG